MKRKGNRKYRVVGGYTRTSALILMRSSRSFFAFSSCACFIRASLRLWNPVRYSSRAAGSKVICSGTAAAEDVVLRFLEGGGGIAMDRVCRGGLVSVGGGGGWCG